MTRLPVLAALVWASAPMPAADTLQVRLRTPLDVSSQRVECVVTAPFRDSAGRWIPAGSTVLGAVAPGSKPQRLRVDFNTLRLDDKSYPMRAVVAEVDNARERVTPDGFVLALDPLRKRPGKVEIALLAAAHAHPAALAMLEGGKLVLRRVERPEVRYSPGVDLALRLETVPEVPIRLADEPPAAAPASLASILRSLPNRTAAYQSGKPADWVNLAFAGSREELCGAFQSAGWQTAETLSLRADLKVFLALAQHHSYRHAPVSRLTLDGRLPDLVFQLQNNTFAKRHHLRIWATNQQWEGKPLWIAAATHDIGIEFSASAKTFTHRIDPNIDRERDKVVRDLSLFAAQPFVFRMARPEVPLEDRNAAGDAIRTDGGLAVLVLNPPSR